MTFLEVIIEKFKNRATEDLLFMRSKRELEEAMSLKKAEWDLHHTLEVRADYESRGKGELWFQIDNNLLDEYCALKAKYERLFEEYRGL